MHPQDPQSELRGLTALVETIRLRVQAEAEVLARSGVATPLLRSCLTRARGHLELAHRALTETRPEDSFGSQRGSRPAIPTLRGPLRLERPIASPAHDAWQQSTPDRRSVGRDHVFRPTGQEGAPIWVQSRVEEIGRALESALGDGFGVVTSEPTHGQPLTPPVDAVGQVPIGAACPAPQAPPQFSGSTDVLSVPDLVGFFQVQAKTGVLEIEHASESFSLEFEHGALMHAASSHSPPGERLGEILVRRGAITAPRLAAFLAHLSRDERLGNALLRMEGVSEADLAGAVEEQVLGIFVRLARLPGCRFAFRECDVEADSAGRIRHNVTRLLLDSARYLDEAAEHRESA